MSSFSHQVWPLKTWSAESLHVLESVLTWIDVIAIVFVLLLFWRGRTTARRWIAARARTELLRQYQLLLVIFPTISAGDPKAKFEAEASQIQENVQKGAAADIAQRIARFWSERKTKFGGHALTEAEVSSDALLIYLKRRSAANAPNT